MELDKALQFAVILAWEDLTKANQERSVRVEYQLLRMSLTDYNN